jgi:competence protein ComEA
MRTGRCDGPSAHSVSMPVCRTPSPPVRRGRPRVLRELRDWAEELACRAGVDGWPAGARRAASLLAVGLLAFAVWRWGLAGDVAGGPATERAGGASPIASAGVSGEASTAGRPSAPETVTVHVVGAVRRPGVYTLPSGARAADAVAAAGGVLGNADQAAVNMARVVADGEQIAVPVQGAAGAGGAGATGAAAGPGARGVAGGKVDLNTATVEQLDTLPGIGPATAQKIVADRTENGPFRSVEDLLRVPGIGAKKLDALKDLVTAG